MKILSELRSLKRQVIELQQNQKEKESKGVPTCSGMVITEVDPTQRIALLEMEVEKLYCQLLDAQTKVINNYENNY